MKGVLHPRRARGRSIEALVVGLTNKFTLQGGCLRQLIGGQLRSALVKVIGNPHRADRVRRRRSRADFVELVDQGHDRTFRILDDLQVRIDRLRPDRRSGWGLRPQRIDPSAERNNGRCHRASHHKRAAIGSCVWFRIIKLRERHRTGGLNVGVHGLSPPWDLINFSTNRSREDHIPLISLAADKTDIPRCLSGELRRNGFGLPIFARDQSAEHDVSKLWIGFRLDDYIIPQRHLRTKPDASA